jgi:hypothetical protein
MANNEIAKYINAGVQSSDKVLPSFILYIIYLDFFIELITILKLLLVFDLMLRLLMLALRMLVLLLIAGFSYLFESK